MRRRAGLAGAMLAALGAGVIGPAALATPAPASRAAADAAQTAKTTNAGRCDRHHAEAKTHEVLVFRVYTRQTDEVGNPLSILYACARPAGRKLELAKDSSPGGPEYPPNDDLRQLTVAGGYAGAIVVLGEADAYACQMIQTNCPIPYVQLSVVEPHGRRKVTFRGPDGTAELSLSSAGAAAWLVPVKPGPVSLVATRLVAHGSGFQTSARQLDTGQISSLRWRGLTLTWHNGNATHSARIS